jgi:hypothetical protein
LCSLLDNNDRPQKQVLQVTVGRYDIEITADIITIFEKINSESRKGT